MPSPMFKPLPLVLAKEEDYLFRASWVRPIIPSLGSMIRIEPPAAPNCRCVLVYDTRTRAMRGNERRRILLAEIRALTKF